METVLQQLVNGLAISSVYALLAIGITVIFGLTGIVNFAHGEFLMFGGLITYSLVSSGWPFVAAAAFSVVAMGAAGWVAERFLFRPTIKEPIRGFIVSLGLIIALQHLAIRIWTSEQQSIPSPLSGAIDFGNVRISYMRIVVLVATVIVCGAVFIGLSRSRWGRGLRAVSIDKETAELMGLPVQRLITMVFVVGSALAGLAGALLLGLFPMSPFAGEQYVLKGFAVAIVGGLGNVGGAVVAALALGTIEAVAGGFISPSWATAYAFVAMIGILVFRPGGLFQGAE